MTILKYLLKDHEIYRQGQALGEDINITSSGAANIILCIIIIYSVMIQH